MRPLLYMLLGVAVFTSCSKSSPVRPVADSARIKLIAYYTFDNTVADSSGNKFDGKSYDISSVQDRFGKPGGAYSFNGRSSYIVVADDSLLRLSQTNFSLNYWVNVRAYSNSYGVITLAKRGVHQNDGWITGVGGQADTATVVGRAGSVTFNVSGGTDPFSFGKKVIALNGWHMVTVTYDLKLASLSIYIDGVLDTVTPGMPSPNKFAISPLFIGADSQGWYNSAYYQYLFAGSLDELRIYNRKISISEIAKLYQAKK